MPLSIWDKMHIRSQANPEWHNITSKKIKQKMLTSLSEMLVFIINLLHQKPNGRCFSVVWNFRPLGHLSRVKVSSSQMPFFETTMPRRLQSFNWCGAWLVLPDELNNSDREQKAVCVWEGGEGGVLEFWSNFMWDFCTIIWVLTAVLLSELTFYHWCENELCHELQSESQQILKPWKTKACITAQAAGDPWVTNDLVARTLWAIWCTECLWRNAEERAGSRLLHLEPAELWELSSNADHSTVQSLGQGNTGWHTWLCFPLYLKHKRHSVATFGHYILTTFGVYILNVSVCLTRVRAWCAHSA